MIIAIMMQQDIYTQRKGKSAREFIITQTDKHCFEIYLFEAESYQFQSNRVKLTSRFGIGNATLGCMRCLDLFSIRHCYHLLSPDFQWDQQHKVCIQSAAFTPASLPAIQDIILKVPLH